MSPNHFEILGRGVRAWNQWRRRYREVRPDLAHVDLRSANLQGMDLSAADLGSATPSGADLTRANLNCGTYLRRTWTARASVTSTCGARICLGPPSWRRTCTGRTFLNRHLLTLI